MTFFLALGFGCHVEGCDSSFRLRSFLGFRWCKDFEEQLFVELGCIAVESGDEQLIGQIHQDAVVFLQGARRGWL